MNSSTPIRFDLADVVFLSKRKELNDQLRELHVDTDLMEITTNSLENEPKVVAAVLHHVVMSAQIDLAFLTIQNIPRTSAVMERIASRFESTASDYFNLLLDILKHSTWWTTSDGRDYYAQIERRHGN